MFTPRELAIIEWAIVHLQNIELNQGFEELKSLFPKNFNPPSTYWELKEIEEKIISFRKTHKSL